MSEIRARLAELRRLGRHRRARRVSGPQGPRVVLDGREALLLCSNNYLGLAADPRVRRAAADAALTAGAGSGASRLVSGSMEIHALLEHRLAAFQGTEACLLFGSGYLANIGVMGALAGAGDTIYSDALNHASIIDGCRLSRARVRVYAHRDTDHLEQLLAEDRGEGSGAALIVTDSIFSMDGDLAPLAEIVELARRHGARTVVDEAHAIGALGPGGRGAVAAAGLQGQIDVVVGTLGKALGSYGAFACAPAETVDYLLNESRPFIFSTAPPPPAVGAALAALEILEVDPALPGRLHAAAGALRAGLAEEGFAVARGEGHIVPLVLGGEGEAMSLCELALERGVFAQGIRPPTVPEGTSRLRLTAMASHGPGELREAARVIGGAARNLGIDPGRVGEQPARAGGPA